MPPPSGLWAPMVSNARRGQIWPARTPGQPRDPHQPRPVLIVSEDVRNRLADEVLAVPLFSRGRLGPTRVRLPEGQGGIPHESVLSCEEVTCLHDDFLASGPLGQAVDGGIMAEVVKSVRRALGEVVP